MFYSIQCWVKTFFFLYVFLFVWQIKNRFLFSCVLDAYFCFFLLLFLLVRLFFTRPYFYICFGCFLSLSSFFYSLSLYPPNVCLLAVFRFIYLFMVKMHLIYDCDGYSSFTGTNSFRIHFRMLQCFCSLFFFFNSCVQYFYISV